MKTEVTPIPAHLYYMGTCWILAYKDTVEKHFDAYELIERINDKDILVINKDVLIPELRDRLKH